MLKIKIITMFMNSIAQQNLLLTKKLLSENSESLLFYQVHIFPTYCTILSFLFHNYSEVSVE
jgi:hypothetical protein